MFISEHNIKIMRKFGFRIIISALLLASLFPVKLFAQDSTQTEKALKVVPLITSTPLMGTGVGVAASYLYNGDKQGNSSKSQFMAGGQYTTTKSYNIFAYNKLWLNNNKIALNLGGVYSSINNEFENSGIEVKYNINTIILGAYPLFNVVGDFYAGIPLLYKRLAYKSINTAGETFINTNGIENENSASFGLALSYDTRTNKYYPSNAAWIMLRAQSNPTWLGATNNYYYYTMDARYYLKGFTKDDVWALQLFGQYSSDKTPDAGLPTISGKTILRGFPSGQFKARYQTGGQAEYRYSIKDTKFRLTAFFGVCNLSGGSYGSGGNSRDDDGWYSAEGIGLRYKIQPVTGVDLRLDLVRTSEKQYGVYLKLNQAF